MLPLVKFYSADPVLVSNIHINTIACSSENEFLQHIDRLQLNVFDCQFVQEDQEPLSPLYFCLRNSYSQALKKFIAMGLRIAKLPVDETDPPFIAFVCSKFPNLSQQSMEFENNLEVLRILLEEGVDPNIPDTEGEAPLDYVHPERCRDSLQDFLKSPKWECIYLLLKHGAKADKRSRTGGRMDEWLNEFFCDAEQQQKCPLSLSQIQELKEIIFKTIEKYTPREDLIPLIERIKSLSYQILFKSFEQDQLEVALHKESLKRVWKRFKVVVNTCSNQLKKINETVKCNLKDTVENFIHYDYGLNFYFKNVLHLHKYLSGIALKEESATTDEANEQTGLWFGKYSPEDLEGMLLVYLMQRDEGQLNPDTLPLFLLEDKIKELLTAYIDFHSTKRFTLKPDDSVEDIEIVSSENLENHRETEICSRDNEEIKSLYRNFFENPDIDWIDPINDGRAFIRTALLDYILNPDLTLDHLGLSLENARSYLVSVKLLDQALIESFGQATTNHPVARSSYALRTKILELCSPIMTTSEAYTISVDPIKINNQTYLEYWSSWVPERILFQQQIFNEHRKKAFKLSERLNHFTATFYAIRGHTAMGKTTFLKNDPEFAALCNEAGVPSGLLNVDDVKYSLKQRRWTNVQVHAEAKSQVFHQLKRSLSREAFINYMMEGRFSTREEIEYPIFKPAEDLNGFVCLFDIAGSLKQSFYRVLTRDPKGKDPCLSSADLIKGYKEAIIYRSQVIDKVKSDSHVKQYKLIANVEHGKQIIVAEKRKGLWKVFREDLLSNSFYLPSDDAIDKESQEIITDDTIAEAMQNFGISAEKKPLLEKWRGFPIGKALDLHAMGYDISTARKILEEDLHIKALYGKVIMQPFSESWLRDCPHFLIHLRSEHILNMRGRDPNGAGIQFSTDEYSSSLNPRYNPDYKMANATQGGFQMKVGYFIVPPRYYRHHLASNELPKEWEELVIRQGAEVTGIRFFVHPEGYEHFKSLHNAGIKFVKPENSEFIGTPTSSYRSWAIRRVYEEAGEIKPQARSIPFIAKLGVSSSSKDTKRLLPTSVIKHSIDMQKYLESIREGADPSLTFFPEVLGLSLNGIPNYPPKNDSYDGEPIDSGIIIRRVPNQLMFSFASLFSVERSKLENEGLCRPNPSRPTDGLEPLPLLFEVMNAAIKKGYVRTPKQFVQTYLIEKYLKAIEHYVFKHGLCFSPHGQNLCLVLDNDFTPCGYAYRDFEGISIHQEAERRFLKQYTIDYRYHFIKALNLVTNQPHSVFLKPSSDPRLKDVLKTVEFSPPGAPLLFGHEQPEMERNTFAHVKHNCEQRANRQAIKILESLKLPEDSYVELLSLADKHFITYLNRYFNVRKARVVSKDGTLPAFEERSLREREMLMHNQNLWTNRRANPLIPPEPSWFNSNFVTAALIAGTIFTVILIKRR